MKITTKLHNPFKTANLLLFDFDGKQINSLPINSEVSTYRIDSKTVSKIAYTVGKYQTESFKIHDNQNFFEIYPNKKIHRPEVSLYSDTNNYGKLEIKTYENNKFLSYRKDGKKKIAFYYSPNFDETKDVEVLFSFDSQNIFDVRKLGNYTTNNDIYKGWQMESAIVNEKKNMIVVGLFNDDSYRDQELTPNNLDLEDFYKDNTKIITKENPDFLNGHLDDFSEFIINDLYYDLKGKYKINKFGICGASSGGLAAHYISIKYKDLFDYAFIFSSASGLLTSQYFEKLYIKYGTWNTKTRFYFYQGGKGKLEKMLRSGNEFNLYPLVDTGISKEKLNYYYEKSYEHNELAWRYAFSFLFNLEGKK